MEYYEISLRLSEKGMVKRREKKSKRKREKRKEKEEDRERK